MKPSSPSAGSWPATPVRQGSVTPAISAMVHMVRQPLAAAIRRPARSSRTVGTGQEARGRAASTVARRLSTVAGFYRFAVIDGIIEHSPAEFVRRPKIDTESTTLGLDRMELGAFIAQGAAGSAIDHALACLLGLLGPRVSEACGIDIEHLAIERAHRIVTVLGRDPSWPSSPAAPGRPGRGHGRRRTIVGATAAGPIGTATESPRRHQDREATRQQGGDHPRRSHRIRCATHSSPPPWTQGCRCVMCRLPPATQTPGRPPATTGHATPSTATPATSSLRSLLAPPDRRSRSTTETTAQATTHARVGPVQ